MDTIWTFRTRNFTVTLACEPEQDMDLPWDDDGEAAEKIESGEWECLLYRVRVIGPNGETLGEAFLGDSIHADRDDFRGDGYFRDMVREAISEARKSLAVTRAIPLRQAA